MDKMKKEWQENGRVSLRIEEETLCKLGQKLEVIAALPNLAGFLTESADTVLRPIRLFMHTETAKDKQEKVKIARDLFLLASFIPELSKITALRKDKEISEPHIDFVDFKNLLTSRGVSWEHDR